MTQGLQITVQCTAPDAPGESRIYSASLLATLSTARPAWAMLAEEDAVMPRKILGAHVYTERAGTAVLCWLRISNGAALPDGSGFCGEVRFSHLGLEAPAGWDIEPVAPRRGDRSLRSSLLLWDGPPLPFRARAILERAFVLVRRHASDEERAAAKRALLMRSARLPDPYVGYGPTESRLPRVNRIKNEEIASGLLAAALEGLERGAATQLPECGALLGEPAGPWHPQGNPEAWTYGGQGIDTTHGEEQCPSMVALGSLLHMATAERMLIACYHKETGAPMRLDEWAKPPERHLLLGDPDLPGEVELLPFLEGDYYERRYRVFNPGLAPDLELADRLGDWRTIDAAHGIRFLRWAIQSAEQGRSPLARDDLDMYSEELSYGEWSSREDERTEPSYPGEYLQPSLRLKLKDALARPGEGAAVDRAFGWVMYARAAAAKLCGPQASASVFSAKANGWSWAWHALKLAREAAGEVTGLIMRVRDSGYMPASVEGVQTFHEALICRGLFALEMQRAAFFRDMFDPGVAGLLARNVRSMYGSLKPRPYGAAWGPPHWIGTHLYGLRLERLAESFCYGEGDPAHVWDLCALAWRATGDEEMLRTALAHWIPHKSLAERLAWCNAQGFDRPWSGEMESALERLMPRAEQLP